MAGLTRGVGSSLVVVLVGGVGGAAAASAAGAASAARGGLGGRRSSARAPRRRGLLGRAAPRPASPRPRVSWASVVSSAGSPPAPAGLVGRLSSAIWLLPQVSISSGLRLLRGVRVLGARVDLELGELLAGEAVAGQHALHGEADDLLGPALEHVVERARLQAARVARVAVVAASPAACCR